MSIASRTLKNYQCEITTLEAHLAEAKIEIDRLRALISKECEGCRDAAWNAALKKAAEDCAKCFSRLSKRQRL